MDRNSYDVRPKPKFKTNLSLSNITFSLTEIINLHLKQNNMSGIKVYSGTCQIKLMEIKNILESEGIAFYEMNKLDSNHTWILGELQIHVSETNAEYAQELLLNIETL